MFILINGLLSYYLIDSFPLSPNVTHNKSLFSLLRIKLTITLYFTFFQIYVIKLNKRLIFIFQSLLQWVQLSGLDSCLVDPNQRMRNIFSTRRVSADTLLWLITFYIQSSAWIYLPQVHYTLGVHTIFVEAFILVHTNNLRMFWL